MSETTTTDTEALVAEHVAAIHAIRGGKLSIQDAVEIGGHLVACKKLRGHGSFTPFLTQEFGWSVRHARTFIRMWKLSKETENFADLPIPVSGMYLLAAPTTPAEVRAEVFELAKSMKVTHDKIATLVARGGRQKTSVFDVRDNVSDWPIDGPGREERAWQRDCVSEMNFAGRAAAKVLQLCDFSDGYQITDEMCALARKAAKLWTEAADRLEQLRQQQSNDVMEAAECPFQFGLENVAGVVVASQK